MDPEAAPDPTTTEGPGGRHATVATWVTRHALARPRAAEPGVVLATVDVVTGDDGLRADPATVDITVRAVVAGARRGGGRRPVDR